MNRRTVLATTAVLATLGLAGCSPDDDGEGDDGGGGVYDADPRTDEQRRDAKPGPVDA